MLSWSKIVVFGVMLTLTAFVFSYAQEHSDYHVYGKVTDSKGKPIPGAKITLKDASSGKTISMKSKDDGSFDQQFVPHALYSLTVEKEGYSPRSVDKVDMTPVSQQTIQRKIDIVLVTPKEEQDQKLVEQQAQLAKEVQDEYKKGVDLYQQQKFDESLATMQDVSKKSPEAYGPYLVMGACYLAKKDVDNAIANFEKTVAIKKDIPDVYRNLGDLYTAKKDFAKAMTNYQALLELSPGDAETRCVVGNIQLAQDKLADAEASVNKAMQDKPDTALCYKVNGELLLKKGDMKGSLTSFKKYLELQPNAADKKEIEDMVSALEQSK